MINNFKDKYSFLSNFYYCSIVRDGKIYSTVEHAYQAAKAIDPVAASNIQYSSSPSEAKKLGYSVELRPDWEDIKIQVMVELIKDKFQTHEDLRNKLMETYNAELIEGNYWHDNYWGSCNCKKCGNRGQNMLGKILMVERSFLQKEYRKKNR